MLVEDGLGLYIVRTGSESTCLFSGSMDSTLQLITVIVKK